MPYQSARDLPSFVEMSQQLSSLKLLRFLIPKSERPKVKEVEAQLNFMGNTVDKFYAVLGPRNWIFHDTLNLQDIADLLAASADPAEAERRLIDYYKGLDNLHFLVRGLGAFEALRKRRHLVQRAYDDYMAQRYYACIHVLLSVMDGFVNEFETVRRGLHAREAEDLVLQPEIVIFMAAGRLVVGSGRRERGLAAGVATMTSATGARDRRQHGRSGPRTGAGPRCRSTRSPLVEPDVGRAR